MKLSAAMTLLPVLAAACADTEVDGSDRCTVEAIGQGTGADTIRATLHVPEQYFTGPETSNGGITVLHEDCDFALNAFMSDETANYIIENAPRETLVDKAHLFYLVDASLFIWKFSDDSGEPRFFVMRVQEMDPISSPRTAQEAKYYSRPPDGA